MSDAMAGGSLTTLPINEIQTSDMSAYIPTSSISITRYSSRLMMGRLMTRLLLEHRLLLLTRLRWSTGCSTAILSCHEAICC